MMERNGQHIGRSANFFVTRLSKGPILRSSGMSHELAVFYKRLQRKGTYVFEFEVSHDIYLLPPE
jgi:hypothetical protein